MKRWILSLIALVFLVAGALLAPILSDDPGQVVIAFGRWELEMSLVAWGVVILAAWLILSLGWTLVRLPGRLIKHQRRQRTQRQMENGFLALTEGEWERAEQSFSNALRHQKSTAGLLGAARAAQGRSDLQARDAWLAQATGHFGRRHFVTEFARARLTLESGRVDEAIELLEHLYLKKRRHLGVLRSLLSAYQDSGRWRQVRELAPALKKAGMIDAQKAEALMKLAGERELAHCGDFEALKETWRALPNAYRKDRGLVLAYAHRAEALGHFEQAGRLLSELLDQGIDDDLLSAYRLTDDNDRASRIAHCEKRLKKTPDQADLLETLGFLYLDDRQYEKAQRCLEQALKQRGSREIYIAMGRLMDRQGESESAARFYRNALQFQSNADQRVLLNRQSVE